MSVDLNKTSVVILNNGVEKHKCGYCNNESGSISNGMFAETLTVEDYQNLIDRGWRRSGKYCYKPIMDETCCPQYTIKCDTSHFCMSKSQKKVIKKFNKFLEDGLLNKTCLPLELESGDSGRQDIPALFSNHHEINLSKVRKLSPEHEEINTFSAGDPHKITCQNVVVDTQQTGSKSADSTASMCKPGIGADANKPPCKKAKIIRRERKKEKLSNVSTIVKNDQKHMKKSLEQLIDEVSIDTKVKLKIRLVPTNKQNSEWENTKNIEFLLYKKYQMLIHNDPPEHLSMKGFSRFLVNSPLQPKKFPNGESPGFGSFHQQYWLNDKLIAVGVIDILPKCISSVYFFYDPDYRNLTLGTYGSLREICLTKSVGAKVPDLKWYYLGFYIHSCPKMRYKGKLSPSLLLCPESYYWIPIEKCLELLDKNKYSRLNEDLDAIDSNFPEQIDVLNMKIIYKNRLMYLKDYKNCDILSMFNHAASLIGKQCTRNMVYWILD